MTMHKVLLLVLLALFTQNSFSQSPKYIIDSLKAQLKSAETDLEKAGIYSELTWFWAMVNLDSALSDGNSSLALAKKLGDQKAIGQAYRDLGNAFNQKFQFEEAKAVDYRNSLTEEQGAQLTSELQSKYETGEKDQEIIVQQLAIRNKNIQLYGLLVLVLTLGIIGYLLYSQQKLKNQQLQQEGNLKAALSQIEIQSKLQEQRLLISRDLQDNIGAQLTFIISEIENLKYFEPIREQLTQRYDTIANFTKQTITELRDTIWAMNSGSVTWEQLSSRIQDYVQEAGLSASHIVFDYEINDRINPETTIASVASIQILRVVKEAVQNAIKNSGADRVEIKIDSTGKEVLINIQDNGKGFEESEITTGNGLYNMRKWAEELGGNLEIHSETGLGTSVLLLWPVS